MRELSSVRTCEKSVEYFLKKTTAFNPDCLPLAFTLACLRLGIHIFYRGRGLSMVSNADLISKAYYVDGPQFKLSCGEIMAMDKSTYRCQKVVKNKRKVKLVAAVWCVSLLVGFHFKFALLQIPRCARKGKKRKLILLLQ